MTTHSKLLKRSLLAISVSMAASSQALEFYAAGLEANLDSHISLGSSWRVQGAAPHLLTNLDGESTNGDDGNRNYAKGDAFSQIFKGSHALQFNYENFGGLLRAKYWYDSALANNSVDYGHAATADVGGPSGTELTYHGNQKLDDSEFADLSKSSGIALMDAFVYGEFDVADMPIDLRLGRQVVSWGESTFIPGGINAINPIDVNAFRRPGGEIKEALLPVNMAYTNIGLSDNLSLEAFYQLEFEGHAIPGCGTYFSTNDYASSGCDSVIIKDGALSIARHDDGERLAQDENQYGVAFRFNAAELGDTEFGFYAMNIHNRAPTVSGMKYAHSLSDESTIINNTVNNYIAAYAVDPMNPTLAEQQAAGAAATASVSAARAAGARYYVSYEEDIQLAGLSFATNVGSMALSGEISHKTDVPVQINGAQLISAIMGVYTADDGAALGQLAQAGAQLQAATNQAELDAANAAILAAQQAQQAARANNSEIDEAVFNGGANENIQGFRLFDISQVQLTAVKFFDQVLGASRLTLIAEAGATYVHGYDEGTSTGLKFGRTATFGHPLDPESEDDGFMTEASWGYRTRLSADYSDVFAGINLTPTLSFSHDVQGYAPQPAGVFQEGQKTLGLSVAANYLETYNASISYTQYMDGKYSMVRDRDFASISFGMQF